MNQYPVNNNPLSAESQKQSYIQTAPPVRVSQVQEHLKHLQIEIENNSNLVNELCNKLSSVSKILPPIPASEKGLTKESEVLVPLAMDLKDKISYQYSSNESLRNLIRSIEL